MVHHVCDDVFLKNLLSGHVSLVAAWGGEEQDYFLNECVAKRKWLHKFKLADADNRPHVRKFFTRTSRLRRGQLVLLRVRGDRGFILIKAIGIVLSHEDRGRSVHVCWIVPNMNMKVPMDSGFTDSLGTISKSFKVSDIDHEKLKKRIRKARREFLRNQIGTLKDLSA